jgi:hypothetical protein
MKYKPGILLPTLFYFFVSLFLFCEAGHAKEAPKTKKQINDECLRNFDMDNVLNDQNHFFIVQGEEMLLIDYYSCRSLIDDAITSRLPGLEDKKIVVPYQRSLLFFRKLIAEGRVTPEIINGCLVEGELLGRKSSVKSCRESMQRFLNFDPSSCGDDTMCRAIFTRDSSLNSEAALVIYWIQALEALDKNACVKIANLPKSMGRKESKALIADACLAHTTHDMKHCENNPNVKRFKERYCSRYAEFKSLSGGVQ